MLYGRYPGSQQAHQPPSQAPKTQQQGGQDETPCRHHRPIVCKVPWITGNQANEEGQEEENCSGKCPSQEAESKTDGDSAYDQTNHQGTEQTRGDRKQFHSC